MVTHPVEVKSVRVEHMSRLLYNIRQLGTAPRIQSYLKTDVIAKLQKQISH